MDLVFANPEPMYETDPLPADGPFSSTAAVTAVDTYWFQPTSDLPPICPFAWDVPRGRPAS